MNRRRIILAILLVLTAGGFLWRLCIEPEPKYEGKGFSVWFRQYYTSGQRSSRFDESLHEEANEALRAMGANAVPLLVEECYSTSHDAGPTNLLKVLSELPRPFRFPPFVPAELIRDEAAQVLYAIKPPAQFIVPRAAIALAGTNQHQRRTAIYLLGDIGEGAESATPWLIQGLRSSDRWEKVLAAQSTARLGPAVKAVIPELINGMTNAAGDQGWIWGICHALGSMGSNAAPAIPILKAKMLVETNLARRMMIAGNLCRIDAGESGALTNILNELKNSENSGKRSSMVFQLGQVGPNAKAAIPFLLEMLADDDLQTWCGAASALKGVGADKSIILPPLSARLKSNDETIRFNAAQQILAIDPGNTEAMALLINEIKAGSLFSRAAIEALGRIGPAAKDAIPVLQQVRIGSDKELARVAASALKRIEKAAPEQDKAAINASKIN